MTTPHPLLALARAYFADPTGDPAIVEPLANGVIALCSRVEELESYEREFVTTAQLLNGLRVPLQVDGRQIRLYERVELVRKEHDEQIATQAARIALLERESLLGWEDAKQCREKMREAQAAQHRVEVREATRGALHKRIAALEEGLREALGDLDDLGSPLVPKLRALLKP